MTDDKLPQPRATCDEVLIHLYEYINHQDVTVELEVQIRQHLDDCRHCFSKYEFEEQLLKRLRALQTTCCPDTLREKIRLLVQHY